MNTDVNEKTLAKSKAKYKLLLDQNVLIYSQKAFRDTGEHLLNYIDKTNGIVSWYVASCEIVKLHNAKEYNISSLSKNMLSCNDFPDKMSTFPFNKKDGSVGAVTLNKLQSDDFAQIILAQSLPDLWIVTNDSAMYKTAHAILDGRAIPFKVLIEQLRPFFFTDKHWLKLKKWFDENTPNIRNNSSWVIEGK